MDQRLDECDESKTTLEEINSEVKNQATRLMISALLEDSVDQLAIVSVTLGKYTVGPIIGIGRDRSGHVLISNSINMKQTEPLSLINCY